MKAKDYLEKKNFAKMPLDEYREGYILDAMIEYAKAKCSDQRTICANVHKEKLRAYWNVNNLDELQDEIDNIINSPTPDFE